jgi:hypothetical protein
MRCRLRYAVLPSGVIHIHYLKGPTAGQKRVYPNSAPVLSCHTRKTLSDVVTMPNVKNRVEANAHWRDIRRHSGHINDFLMRTGLRSGVG